MQDGLYPRLNSKMFNAPGDQFGVVDGALLSIVGKIDPSSLVIHAADGGAVPFAAEGIELQHGSIVEAIGILDSQHPGPDKRFTVR
jgi:hypothetical protein